MKPSATAPFLVCWCVFLLGSAAARGAITYVSASRSVSASAPFGGTPSSASTNGFEDFDVRVTSVPLPPLSNLGASASQRSRLLSDRIEVACTAFVDGQILGSIPRYESSSILSVIFELDSPSWVTLYSGPIFRGIGQSSVGVFLGTDTLTVFSVTSTSVPLSALLPAGQYRLSALLEASNRGMGGSGLSAAIFTLVIPTPQTSALAVLAIMCFPRRRR